MEKEIEIYIHVPFCVKKCAYCDFLSGPGDEVTIEHYVEALIQEISQCNSKKRKSTSETVTTVFLGGGTPSILSPAQIERIMGILRETFEIEKNAEITIEANPGTVTREKLKAYRCAGINRISFGLQSTNNEELKLLGRIHTFKDFLESFHLARSCGFDNINVDLISAVPRQTVESWEASLKRIIELNPEHVSAYSLIVEEGTPFAKRYGEGTEGEKELPAEEDERMMYQRTEELLEEAGYHRYEISNYAKPGRECRHNQGYWERKNYLGIGLGASSLVDNIRYKNTDDLDFYMKHAGEPDKIQEDMEQLSVVDQMEEFIFLGLRKMQGISMKEFQDVFGRTLNECYGENIERMQKSGLIVMEDGFFRLTKRGIDVSNYVFAEILG
ncbi:MAG: oxygen-independent coproporphyrinogen III oxidase [Tyzzerella sp.]|nr:oxygen-independent coproporphyrinogen III oxidase [Tyzzerella sp.]